MLTKIRNRALVAVILPFLTAGYTWAQAPLGTRASGMAGAFVAVADDATAVYWNPAGIATGSFVSLAIDFGKHSVVPETPQTAAGQRDTATMVALSATAIGLAYYRLETYGTGAATPAGTSLPSREEVRRSVHALTTSTAGVSLVQSIGDHLVVGATPKFMRGSARRGASGSEDLHDALDTAKGLDGPAGYAFDVDAGAMVTANHFRVGLVARNLATPAFATASASAQTTADGTAGEQGDNGGQDAIELEREVRLGVAWGSAWPGLSRVIVSMDGDLTSRATFDGDRRDLAAGVETWWRNQRLGLRGGVRGSTIGDARAAVAAGISAGLTSGMLLEAHVVRGQGAERSWSLGARMSF